MVPYDPQYIGLMWDQEASFLKIGRSVLMQDRQEYFVWLQCNSPISFLISIITYINISSYTYFHKFTLLEILTAFFSWQRVRDHSKVSLGEIVTANVDLA